MPILLRNLTELGAMNRRIRRSNARLSWGCIAGWLTAAVFAVAYWAERHP